MVGGARAEKSRRHIRQERGPRSDPMTQPNLQVNAEGGISDEVCAEIIQSIRFVPNFPKPVFPDHARAIGLVKSGTWRQNALCATCARLSRAPLLTRLSLPHCTSHCDVGIFVLTRDSLAQGLQFKDMSMLLANPTAFRGVIDALAAKYSKRDITAVVGIGLSPNFTLHLLSCRAATIQHSDASIARVCACLLYVPGGPECRGFVFAAPVAYALKVPFVPLRKPGKLPCKSIGVDFKQSAGRGTAQFGKDRLEMHEVLACVRVRVCSCVRVRVCSCASVSVTDRHVSAKCACAYAMCVCARIRIRACMSCFCVLIGIT